MTAENSGANMATMKLLSDSTVSVKQAVLLNISRPR